MSDNFNQNNDFKYNYAEEDNKENLNNPVIIKPSIKNKKHPYFSQMVTALIACVICSGITFGTLSYEFTNKLNAQNAIIQKLEASTSSLSLTNAAYATTNDISLIVSKVSPSVVGIKLNISANTQTMGYRFFNQAPQEAAVEGSGIVLTKDGYIATNYHVVSYADPNSNSNVTLNNMEVHFSDGTIAKATFVGGDEKNDLAVIKVDLNNLTPATLGNSSSTKVGDTALAIGNPLGLDFAGTVTQGIISAVDRAVDTGDGTTMNLMQTDAAINEGNSGGALVNANGEVIGINCAKIEASGVEGIGFAIPINNAKPILESFMK